MTMQEVGPTTEARTILALILAMTNNRLSNRVVPSVLQEDEEPVVYLVQRVKQ